MPSTSRQTREYVVAVRLPARLYHAVVARAKANERDPDQQIRFEIARAGERGSGGDESLRDVSLASAIDDAARDDQASRPRP